MKLEEYLDEVENPSHSVYIMFGEHEVVDVFIRKLYAMYENKVVIEKIDNRFKKFRFKPLGKKKNVVILKHTKNVKFDDIKELNQYVKDVYKNTILVVHVDNYKDKRVFDKFFRDRNSEAMKIDLMYPGYRFVRDFVIYNADEIGVKFFSKFEREMFIQRVGNNLGKLRHGLETLSLMSDKPISKDIIKRYIDVTGEIDTNRLCEAMVSGKSINKVTKEINIMIENDTKISSIILKIKEWFEYARQAKEIYNKGYLRINDDIVTRIQEFEKTVNKKNKSITKLPRYKVDYFLEQSKKMSEQEIQDINLQLEEAIRFIKYDEKGMTIAIREYGKFKDAEYFSVILKITNRYGDAERKKKV